MIKKVNVTFDFDLDTETVSNVKCLVDEVSATAKRAASTKKPKAKDDDEPTPIVRLEDNKLVFNSKAAKALEIEWQSRVNIKYEKFGNRRMPIIGSDLSFDEEGSGNKLTKTNTISYRGTANKVLSEYGNEFHLEEYASGIYKMIPVGDSVSESVGIELPTPKIKKAKIEKIKELSQNNTDTKDIIDFTFSL